jgi:regulation of enolase protein 1 (concanavalin A-like superfamily)
MAEVWSGEFGLGSRLGRRGAVRLLAGAAAVAAGSAALTACGGAAVPGAVATNGGASVNATSAKETAAATMVSNHGGTISLVARGKTIGTSTADDTTFYFGSATGDGKWSCQVKAQGSDTTDKGNALAGIMARDSGDPGAAFVGVFITDGNGVTFRWRRTQGTAAEQWPMAIAIGVTAPIWLQLQKQGDNFTVSYSQDGKTWLNNTSMAVSFTNTTYLIGLAACASSTKQEVDQFTNLSGFKPTSYLDINPANASASSSSK